MEESVMIRKRMVRERLVDAMLSCLVVFSLLGGVGFGGYLEGEGGNKKLGKFHKNPHLSLVIFEIAL